MMRSWSWVLLLAWAATSIQSLAASPATDSVGAVPGPNDPRTVAWIDPNRPLDSYPKQLVSLQVGQDSDGKNIERDLTTFPDPGYRDPTTSEFTVMRTADPERTAGKAFRHKMDYFSHTKYAHDLLEKLASTGPETLGCMHGSAWRGDGAKLLRALANELSQ